MRELGELGLEKALAEVAITTREIAFYNRFGQFIYSDPCGRYAGYDVPQFSIHRGDLQMVLLDAFIERAGADAVITGHRCTGIEQDERSAIAHFEHAATKQKLPSQRGSIVVSCEGIHSVIRKQFFPDEGPPKYSGINMWRGVTRWKPILTGASMMRIGWHKPAKLLIYPIRDKIDAEGRQLVNWVLDIETPDRAARLEPAGTARGFHRRPRGLALRLARRAGDSPRRRRDPRISDGRPGPAAALELRSRHAARRRGAPDVSARRERRGAGDTRLPRARRSARASTADPVAALKAYEAERLPATTARWCSPTARRRPTRSSTKSTGAPATSRSGTSTTSSARRSWPLLESYKRVAGYDKERLRAGGRR